MRWTDCRAGIGIGARGSVTDCMRSIEAAVASPAAVAGFTRARTAAVAARAASAAHAGGSPSPPAPPAALVAAQTPPCNGSNMWGSGCRPSCQSASSGDALVGEGSTGLQDATGSPVTRSQSAGWPRPLISAFRIEILYIWRHSDSTKMRRIRVEIPSQWSSVRQ